MDKNLIEKYKKEMMSFYNKVKATPQKDEENKPSVPVIAAEIEKNTSAPDGEGGLIGIITSLNEIYPVKGAKVTVFTGNYDKMNVIDTDYTDPSGKTKTFTLSAPKKALSESAGASQKPYSSYNMLVEADGYIDNIHLNIPIFSGVISLQGSDMMLSETAGENMGPQIFDEGQEYTL